MRHIVPGILILGACAPEEPYQRIRLEWHGMADDGAPALHGHGYHPTVADGVLEVESDDPPACRFQFGGLSHGGAHGLDVEPIAAEIWGAVTVEVLPTSPLRSGDETAQNADPYPILTEVTLFDCEDEGIDTLSGTVRCVEAWAGGTLTFEASWACTEWDEQELASPSGWFLR